MGFVVVFCIVDSFGNIRPMIAYEINSTNNPIAAMGPLDHIFNYNFFAKKIKKINLEEFF